MYRRKGLNSFYTAEVADYFITLQVNGTWKEDAT
jgi:hypothetical protein